MIRFSFPQNQIGARVLRSAHTERVDCVALTFVFVFDFVFVCVLLEYVKYACFWIDVVIFGKGL